METLFFLEAKCSECGKTFYPRYDYAADDRWVLTYGVKELPMGTSAVSSLSSVDISDARIGPQYKCPYCGNNSFVKCGKCHNLTCYDDSKNHFTCAHCGSSGEIGGHISDVEIRSSGKGQN